MEIGSKTEKIKKAEVGLKNIKIVDISTSSTASIKCQLTMTLGLVIVEVYHILVLLLLEED